MQPEVMRIGPLMTLQAPFKIPKYQRGFAWDKDQIRDFVNDILTLHRTEDSTPHFFGGLVSIRRSEANTPAGVAYEVVDGQQRLTVFTLALNAIVSAYRQVAADAKALGGDEMETVARRGSTTADLEEETYLRYSYTDSNGNRISPYKLRLSRIDREFFDAQLRGQRLTGRRTHSHNLLRRADAALRAQLTGPIISDEELTPAERFSRLQTLRASITDRCYLVHLVSEDDAEAYQLFTVLNDRGKSLSEAELLRTHSLRLLENFEADQVLVEQRWEPIIAGRPSEIIAFLRNYYASHLGKRWPSRGLHDAYVREFLDRRVAAIPAEAAEIVDRVNDLHGEHELHSKIRTGEWPYPDPQESLWRRIRLSRLVNSLGLDASLPLLLSLAKTRPEPVFAEAVLTLERFAFRYIAAGGHASEMGDRLYEEASKFRDDDNYSVDGLRGGLRRLLLKYARDNAFKSGLFNRLRYQTTGSNTLLRYFLTTVEDHYDWLAHGHNADPVPNPVAVFDLTQVTIEHIYPQRPRAREQIPDMAAHVHELGNLAFWGPGENPRAGNLSFDVKRSRHYPRSSVRLVSELANLDAWNEAQFELRQERLIQWAIALFPIPRRAEGEAEEDEGPAVWLVQQNADSDYRDQEGLLYDYPYNIANALGIAEGDGLVCYRSRRDAQEGRRIFGIGRIGSLIPDGDRLLAIYDRYAPLDPALTFEAVGGDPRRSLRNSINRITDSNIITSLLGAAGVTALDDLPPVEVSVDDIRAEVEPEFSDETVRGNEE